jgi:hypothetical protein
MAADTRISSGNGLWLPLLRPVPSLGWAGATGHCSVIRTVSLLSDARNFLLCPGNPLLQLHLSIACMGVEKSRVKVRCRSGSKYAHYTLQ